MSRPLRIELPNGLYHVTSRGDRREPIFDDDRDRMRFLAVVAQAMARFGATAYSYCLMGNHYHVVLRTRQPNLSRLMRHVNGVYSQAFNRRHGLVGHLFQGRFKAIHVDGDAYLAAVCRYVELNPVRAGLADEPSAWRWSSHGAHLGIVPGPPWLDSMALFGHLLGRDPITAEDRRMARARYAQLVNDGRDDRLWDRALRQDVFLGEARFIEQVQARMGAGQATSRDIPAAHTRPPGRSAESGPPMRERAMLHAHVQEGQSLSSIARSWNLSVSRVSRLIKRAELQQCEEHGTGT